MRPIPLAVLAAVALASVVGSTSGADEPGTAPRCAVAGPAFGDRSAPLRAGLPARKTLIALTPEEVRAVPSPLPAGVRSVLEQEGAMLMLGSPTVDGWYEQKIPWQRDRRAKGRLEISGQRIDAPTGRFRAHVNRLYGGRRFARFVPGAWEFSEPGCWRVKARAGKVRVSYVVLVRRPQPGEFAPYLP